MLARLTAAGVIFATFAVLATPLACADEVADFYRGKPVDVVVGYGPGGGYDVYARLMAAISAGTSPAIRTVIVQNMPGAGQPARRQLARQCRAEGRHRDRAFRAQHAADRGCSAAIPTRSSIRAASPGSAPRRARQRRLHPDRAHRRAGENDRRGAPPAAMPPLVLGGTAEGATGNDVPIILRDTIGLNVKQVVGYPDSDAIFLAIERGEVHGRTVDLSSVTHQAGMAQAEQRLSRPGAVRARDASPGLSGRADRARACQER